MSDGTRHNSIVSPRTGQVSKVEAARQKRVLDAVNTKPKNTALPPLPATTPREEKSSTQPKHPTPTPPRVKQSSEGRPKKKVQSDETPKPPEVIAPTISTLPSETKIVPKSKSDGILCERDRYSINDVVLFEFLDENNVWQWSLGRIISFSSRRVACVATWRPYSSILKGTASQTVGADDTLMSDSLSDEEREKLQTSISNIKEKGKRAAKDRELAEEMAKALQEESVRILALQKETEVRLADVIPVLEEARDAVSSISLESLREMRNYPKPPPMVQKVLEAVMMMLDAHADDAEKKAPRKSKLELMTAGNNENGSSASSGNSKKKTSVTPQVSMSLSWKAIKQFVRREDFIPTVRDYDPDRMTVAVRERLKKEYIADTNFSYENAHRASVAAGPLYIWVVAQVKYAELVDSMKPQLEEMENLKRASGENEKRMQEVHAQLRNLEKEIAELTAKYQEAVFGYNFVSQWNAAAAGAAVPSDPDGKGAEQHDDSVPPGVAVASPFKNWVPSGEAPKPILHSSIMFAVNGM